MKGYTWLAKGARQALVDDRAHRERLHRQLTGINISISPYSEIKSILGGTTPAGVTTKYWVYHLKLHFRCGFLQSSGATASPAASVFGAPCRIAVYLDTQSAPTGSRLVSNFLNTFTMEPLPDYRGRFVPLYKAFVNRPTDGDGLGWTDTGGSGMQWFRYRAEQYVEWDVDIPVDLLFQCGFVGAINGFQNDICWALQYLDPDVTCTVFPEMQYVPVN